MLDRQFKALPYVTGRLAALIESVHELHNNKFGKVNMSLVPAQPSLNLTGHLTALKHCKGAWEKELAEIMCLLPADGIPEKLNNEEQSQLWVGYYHEKSHIDRNMIVCETVVETHTAPSVECSNVDNTIDDLRK